MCKPNETTTGYRYLAFYNIYEGDVIRKIGRSQFVTPNPILTLDDFLFVERNAEDVMGTGHRCMITNYQLMARRIDGVWVSADA